MRIKSVLLLFLLAGLFSCAQQVTSISTDVDVKMEEGDGYLLIGVDTNRILREIYISGEKSLLLSSQDLKKGTNYILINVPAGEYQLERVRFSRRTRVELSSSDYHWKFNVAPGVVSYVGHLDVETQGFTWLYFSNLRSHLELENRSSDALVFMEENFPTILNNRWISYQGPGNDPFFDYLKQLPRPEVN